MSDSDPNEVLFFAAAAADADASPVSTPPPSPPALPLPLPAPPQPAMTSDPSPPAEGVPAAVPSPAPAEHPHEHTPLIDFKPTPQRVSAVVPTMVDDLPGDAPPAHSRFGLDAFKQDIADMQSGSVPVSLLIAAVIGVACGVAAFVYYKILEFLLEFLWKAVPEFLAEHVFWPECLHWIWIPIVGLSMAFLVGYSINVLGFPGDLAYTVRCVHKEGYVPISHAPSMLVASQVSILGGGSLGPEAPLVAICASVAGWISLTVFKQQYKNLVRKHTLCGMACALAAFFGVPLGGSLFALEVNNRLGYEYFEHALEAIASGTICLVVFRALAQLPIGPIYLFSELKLDSSSAGMVVVGAVLGLIGAGVAAVFAHGHWALVKQLKKLGWDSNPIKLSMFGGVGIVLLGLLFPQTMFWGEFEMQTIGSLSPASKLPHIWPTSGLSGFEISGWFSAFVIGVAKLVAISFTVAGGYRGGFIFPFFAAGAAFGRSLTFLFPSMPPVVAVLSVACGINVAITRTALATPLILCGLAGEVNATPPVLAASLAAVFATYYMPFVFAQQAREDIFESQLHSYTFHNKWGARGENPFVEATTPDASDVESVAAAAQ